MPITLYFPPAARYLLGLGGGDFQLLLRASDYLDLITIIMLAMGVIFQMPAITYVLARIGLVNARFLIRSWKISLIVILIVAAVVSPTGDIPNMLLFAAPMIVCTSYRSSLPGCSAKSVKPMPKMPPIAT